MNFLVSFYKTTVGKKVVMAITGLVMVGFLVAHMAGNLKIFAGIDPASGLYKLDLYAEYLRAIGHELLGHTTVLWISRVVLLSSVVLHATAAIQLGQLNRASRPIGYARINYKSATFASRTMMLGGLTIAVFIVYHILHFTTGTVHFEGFQEGRVYANLYNGFSVWYNVAFYLVALTAIAFHLYHGGWSMFQTLGLDSPRWNLALRDGAKVLAVLLWIGFAAVPISVYFGILDAPVAGEHMIAGLETK